MFFTRLRFDENNGILITVLGLQEQPCYNILKLTSLFLACLLQVALCLSVLNKVLLVFASVSDL